MMDASDLSIESEANITSSQIFSLLYDFFESLVQTRPKVIIDSFMKDSDQLFEILQNTMDSFPLLFFEFLPAVNSTLIEYSIIKFMEISQFVSEPLIRDQIVKILLGLIILCKIRSNKEYQSVTTTIFHIISRLIFQTNQALEKLEDLKMDIFCEDSDSITRISGVIVLLFHKLFKRDKRILLHYSKEVWEFINFVLTFERMDSNVLKLMFTCFYSKADATRDQTLRASRAFYRYLASDDSQFHVKLLKFFGKIAKINPSNFASSFLLGMAEYFISMYDFFNLKNFELELCKTFLDSHSNYMGGFSYLIKLFKDKLLMSDLPGYYISKYNLIDDPQATLSKIYIKIFKNKVDFDDLLGAVSNLTAQDPPKQICFIKLLFLSNQLLGVKIAPETLQRIDAAVFRLTKNYFCYLETICLLEIVSYLPNNSKYLKFVNNAFEKFPNIYQNAEVSWVFNNFDPEIQPAILVNVVGRIPVQDADSWKFLHLVTQSQTFSLVESSVLKINDVTSYLKVSIGFRAQLTPLIEQKIFKMSLLDLEEEQFELYLKFIIKIIMNNIPDAMVTQVNDFLEQPLENQVTFRQQNRFIHKISQLLLLLANEVALFEKLFSKVVYCSLYFSHAFIPLMSQYIALTLKRLNCSLIDLYHSNSTIFVSPFLQLLKFSSSDLQDQLLHLMSNLNLLFDSKDSNILISYLISELLKLAVINRSSPIIQAIANIKNCCPKQLILNHTKYLIPHILAEAPDKRCCITFIEEHLNVSISSVIRSEFQVIIHHCFLYLYDHTDAILSGILALLDDFPFSKNYSYQLGCLSEFFQSRLLGILAFYNFSLISGDITFQKNVIKSMQKLIEHAGQAAIDRYRLKIISLLIFATEISSKYNLSHHVLAAWSIFVDMINDKYLGSLMPQIVLNCLPMVTLYEDEVHSVIYKAILENSAKTHSYLSLLHVFCSKPSFKQLWMILSKFWTNMFQQNVTNILRTFKDALSCDYIEVRRTAIINLSDYLLNCRLNSSTIIDKCDKTILMEIYNELLKCCSNVRSEVLLEAGRCLGILGSIDYNYFAHLESVSVTNKKIHTIPTEIKIGLDEFGVSLLTCLANAFLSITETHYQDCAAFAIQEVLIVYQVSGHGLHDNPFIKKFPQMVQEVLIPHMTSSYSSKPIQPQAKTMDTLFGSTNATTHNSWIRLWCSTLISYISCDTLIGRLLGPCYAIVRYHDPTAKFLLPYVLISIFEADSSLLSCVSKEINVILNVSDVYQNINEDKALAISTVFENLDFLSAYARQEKNQIIKEKLNKFLNEFSKMQLCKAAFVCKTYARALRNIEQHILNDVSPSNCLIQNLPLIKRIYFCLNDYDGIIGASRLDMSCQPDSSDVNQLEIEGRFMEAISYYDRQLLCDNSDAARIKYHQGILKNYLNLGQFQSMISYFHNVEERNQEGLVPQKLEALCRLSKWEELDRIISNQSQNLKAQYESQSSIVINSLIKNHPNNFKDVLKTAYRNVAKNLSISGDDVNTLKRCSSTISRLHLLFDIESFYRINNDLKIFDHPEDIESVSNLYFQPKNNNFSAKLNDWRGAVTSRLEHTEFSFDLQEPILHTHRILLALSSPSESTSIWVSCAKLARKCGFYQTAFNYLLNVDENSSENLFYVYEMAKFLEKTRSSHEALNFLRKKVTKIEPKGEDEGLVYTNLKLMNCQLMKSTSDCDPSGIIKAYNEILTSAKNMEKVNFCVGNYLDKLVFSKNKDGNPKMDFNNSEVQIIHHYGSSLKFGYKYIHQSLPRMVTLWLDYPVNFESQYKNDAQADKNKSKLSSTLITEMNKRIGEICDKILNISKMLPPFVFYSVLPQLVSRICHQNSQIWNVLLIILIKLLATFPRQVSWQMTGIAHSSFVNRVKRCKMVYDGASKESTEIGSFINSLQMFTTFLLDVCNHREKLPQISLSKVFPNLKCFVNQMKDKKILMPILSTLTCKTPPHVNIPNHTFFEHPTPYIIDIDDRIDVLSSLIRPKKVVFLASNGRKYSMLCKPKDDLRRDSRLMEFNSLVNKLLDKNPKSRKRNLRIHLYAVVPLNDECGILEWVEKTVSYRSVVNKLYAERKLGIPLEKIKEMYNSTQRLPDALLKMFTERVLPAFPPVLYNYFFDKYQDASSWLAARQLYTRSVAVMSMIGYILGLGDRHGENVLFVENGEVVHVDFNCLFNKGDVFEWPEKVPFRLTHNMVDVMGPLGIESCFRSTCEITMEIMRSRVDSLVGVLSTFLHDPLVEWVKQRKNVTVVGEQGNEMARKMLTDVEKRLLGIIPQSHFNVSLSVQGKVNELIQEATNLRNLSQMYFGWGAYF
ncbi:Serine/threonine-protein kinase atr [Thelohanellus kitauei]|uniref:Serine/threonine-protein kinase ATR n=1 Tax=Thelohanellus kitauei TaxID=669202 RepID=A0A0C2JN43_THEKT|nr:Serine/threonine-protein kinase atr [Thelohanellus kitauei]